MPGRASHPAKLKQSIARIETAISQLVEIVIGPGVGTCKERARAWPRGEAGQRLRGHTWAEPPAGSQWQTSSLEAAVGRAAATSSTARAARGGRRWGRRMRKAALGCIFVSMATLCTYIQRHSGTGLGDVAATRCVKNNKGRCALKHLNIELGARGRLYSAGDRPRFRLSFG